MRALIVATTALIGLSGPGYGQGWTGKQDFAGVSLGMSWESLEAYIKRENCVRREFRIGQPNSFAHFSCPTGSFKVYAAGLLPSRPVYSITFRYCSVQTEQEVKADLRNRFGGVWNQYAKSEFFDNNRVVVILTYSTLLGYGAAACSINGTPTFAVEIQLLDKSLEARLQSAPRPSVAAPKY